MSLSNIIRIPLFFPHVDVFTFGESTLFGYDSLNPCLVVLSLHQLNNSNDPLIDRLYFSSIPTYPIRQLILNQDETIVALISDKFVDLVYLPQSNSSPSKGSHLCPIRSIPPLIPDSKSINDLLIDFVWLSPNHFVVVNSVPSSSECHLYIVRPSKSGGIEHIQTFSVGSSTIKDRHSGTSNKKVSLHLPSDIVKLDLAKRKQEDLILILLFAIKANGDIFIMQFDQNQLTNNEGRLGCSFVGPIVILPSKFNNYGGDHSHSYLLCLSYSQFVIILLRSGKCEINECIVLNPSLDEYYLFTIDSIEISTNENNQIIKSMIIDQLNNEKYYISDSLSNIYSIEIKWINQIQFQQQPISQTNIQHLIKSNHFIQQFALIQTNNKGQCLAIINKTQNNQQKELIVLRPHSLSLSSFNSTSIKSPSSFQSIKSNRSTSSSEFLNRIQTILQRDQSLPHLTLSSSSSSSSNISNSDFEKNLRKFIKIFSEEYIHKQEKVKIELENKERYLSDFQQTQLIAKQELDTRFQQIQQTIETLNQQLKQEYFRRKKVSSDVNDLLSVIEKHTPVLSDGEILMHQQLDIYQIQINSLKEKLSLMKEFLLREEYTDQYDQQIDQSSMENIQTFVQYFRNEIDQMKQQIQMTNQ